MTVVSTSTDFRVLTAQEIQKQVMLALHAEGCGGTPLKCLACKIQAEQFIERRWGHPYPIYVLKHIESSEFSLGLTFDLYEIFLRYLSVPVSPSLPLFAELEIQSVDTFKIKAKADNLFCSNLSVGFAYSKEFDAQDLNILDSFSFPKMFHLTLCLEKTTLYKNGRDVKFIIVVHSPVAFHNLNVYIVDPEEFILFNCRTSFPFPFDREGRKV